MFQRVFRQDGSYSDHLAGTFEYHPSHGHTHFGDFAEYNLRAVLPDNQVGDVVATGGKESFCLIDLDDYDSTLPGSPEVGHYKLCDGTVQGLSVGWADVYPESLPDQWIDVTGVPLDNTGWKCAWTRTITFMLEHLTIHAPGNDDVFLWTADLQQRTGVLTVEAQFDHHQGDINVFVYNTESLIAEIGLSIGTDNTEKVVVPVSRGAQYYIRVIGAGDDTRPDYSLSLSAAEDPGNAQADALEPNDRRTNAERLPSGNVTLSDLTIHFQAARDSQ